MRKVIVTSFLTLDWVVQPEQTDEGDCGRRGRSTPSELVGEPANAQASRLRI